MNGTEHEQDYTVTVSGLPGLALAEPVQLHVAPTGIGMVPVRLTLPPDQAQAYQGKSNPIVFEVRTEEDGKLRVTHEKSTFFVPR
jgi:hypothetical protein